MAVVTCGSGRRPWANTPGALQQPTKRLQASCNPASRPFSPPPPAAGFYFFTCLELHVAGLR